MNCPSAILEPVQRAPTPAAPVRQRRTRSVLLRGKYGVEARVIRAQYLWAGAADGPTIIVQGGISASRDVLALDNDATPGWWRVTAFQPSAVMARWPIISKYCTALRVGSSAPSNV